jgi:hypothetical protein
MTFKTLLYLSPNHRTVIHVTESHHDDLQVFISIGLQFMKYVHHRLKYARPIKTSVYSTCRKHVSV